MWRATSATTSSPSTTPAVCIASRSRPSWRSTPRRRPPCAPASGMLDVALRGGTVIDGTGAPPRVADVGVRDGRIVSIGSLDGLDASHLLDVTNLVVAPGFIDIHSHSDATLLVDPRARSAIAQGVTTEV